MAKYKVEKMYVDRFSKDLKVEGQIIEETEKRGKELKALGLVSEVKDKKAK